MFRRHLITSLALTAVVAVALGLLYPLAMTGVGKVAFPWRTQGSYLKVNGKVVGSALIGQEFLGKDGNADPKYFQPRPSAAGNGDDPTASGASNLGPSDPKLVGFIPGFNTVALDGNTSKTNPFATKDDPYCVPTDPTGTAVTSPSAGQKYQRNADGSYACYPNTVPERVAAYRQLNGLPDSTAIPVDAVTGSASGLDPDISVANADLQAARVAKARGVPVSEVEHVVATHTNSPQLGVLGEKTVNVLDLNLALDALHA
jgi:K+-transporting ATPase ATPase C chain